MQAMYDNRNPAALRRLVSGGAKLAAFPKTVMDEAFAQSMALYSELNDKNPTWKKVYTDYSNFRREQNQWFRVTEAQFDRYMQSAKL
jgi:TRAP-type mannitol/chloroaromatic compound transport system substrate-binding protein